jgi:hypothetical protein
MPANNRTSGLTNALSISALMLLIVCFVPTAHSQIKASPLSSRSPSQQFPRISGLSPRSLQDQVNALLAKRESQDLDRRKECLASGMPGAPLPTYEETIHTVYLSSRLLSIDVRATWIGCAAYPNINITEPLTIDLHQGKILNWQTFFKDGFFKSDEKQSSMALLYLRHAALTPECNDVVNKTLTEYILWLDSQNGLMIRPALPHAIQACSKLISVPFSEIKDQVNPTLREDLPVSMRPAATPTAQRIP